MVSTQDSESCDPSSSLGRTYSFFSSIRLSKSNKMANSELNDVKVDDLKDLTDLQKWTVLKLMTVHFETFRLEPSFKNLFDVKSPTVDR